MNIESLKRQIDSGVTPVTLPQDQVAHLRPLTAADRMIFSAALKSMGYTSLSVDDKPEDVAKAQCLLVSKSIVESVDGQWVKTLDNDEGRELLTQLDGFVLAKLWGKALSINNMEAEEATEKKDSPPTNDLPEGSALPAG